MISPFRWRRAHVAPPSLPEDVRIYAIGDIHGRVDLLKRLLARIEEDLGELEARAAPRTVLVYLGDYIDRGPEAAAVLDLLLQNPLGLPSVFLKGNHEAMLLAFLEDPEGAWAWLEYGGRETLMSYGLEIPPGPLPRTALRDLHGELREKLPRDHFAFLQRLRLTWSQGDYLFVHAGIHPGRPFKRQREEDLLWIREPFLSHPGPFEKVVVHGHTPCQRPENLPWRINLDTGACFSNRLTALVLEGESRRFLTT